MSEWVYTGCKCWSTNSNDIKDKYMTVSKHLLHTWWIHASNCSFLFGFFQFPFLSLGLYRRWASLSCPTPTVTMPTMIESQATWCVPAWLREERTPARWVWVHVNTYKWVWSHDVKHQSQRRQWNLWRTQNMKHVFVHTFVVLWRSVWLDWVCVQMFSSHWKTGST